MARTLKLLLILTVIGSLTAVAAVGQVRAFGFGGALAMAFIPDMTGINAFMSENGLPSMGDFLIGAGGNGRGGIIGGPAFGGIGWGLLGYSEAGDSYAEFVSAGGGFDLGAAIGGDAGSVLTIGAVLGGGANIMSVSTWTLPDGGDGAVGTCGLVIEPTLREFGRAFGFVQPYLSMAAQIFPWMGFEFRVGYIFPVAGLDFGDVIGIPTPSMDLSGPTISFGITFGGIASGSRRERAEEDRDEPREPQQVTLSRGGSFALEGAEELVVENYVGEILVESYRAEVESTDVGAVVRWDALLTSGEGNIDNLQIETSVSGLSASVKTHGEGEVNYILRVPAGTDLKVKNGVGVVTLIGHEARTIILENGVGEINVEGTSASALFASTGIGQISMQYVTADKLVAEAAVGAINVELDASTSATLFARARLGEVSIDRFPGMVGGVRGFLGGIGDVTLGDGEDVIELKVGIGAVEVTIQP